MAADNQEPVSLAAEFFKMLAAGAHDVAVGTREGRDDPWTSQLFSGLFWGFFRRFVIPEIPPGGVDVFGCNAAVRDELLRLEELNSSLVG
jgi:polyisoprenyl-phosphate glycosyltransferase